jgi:hypothetical protein
MADKPAPEKATTKILIAVVSGVCIWLLGANGWLGAGAKWLWTRVGNTWGWLNSSHLVNGWLIVLLSFAALVMLAMVGSEFWSFLSKPAQRHWKEFTSFQFFGIRWRWGYDYGNAIFGLSPFCPDKNCDNRLTLKIKDDPYSGGHVVGFRCGRCGSNHSMEGSSEEIEYSVKVEIDRLVRTGQWANLPEYREEEKPSRDV